MTGRKPRWPSGVVVGSCKHCGQKVNFTRGIVCPNCGKRNWWALMTNPWRAYA